MQYSINDGTKYGNLNWSYGLIVPNIPGVTDGGCDFYKPSQNLVNAYRTDADGHPFIDTFNNKDYDLTQDADPRLFLTCRSDRSSIRVQQQVHDETPAPHGAVRMVFMVIM